MKLKFNAILIIALTLLLFMGSVSIAKARKDVKLSDEQIEDIVKRSYQYVAMYNVNQKMALAEEGVTTKGYNKGMRKTELLDHTVQFIARPNNDVLYQLAMLDLRKDANAFWSFTLYDAVKGFFIPNDHKKYSVGENAGRKLNEDGGIDIYIAAEKPAGVPDENWLPIQREDLELTVTLRIYAPDLEKMKTWKAPKVEMVK